MHVYDSTLTRLRADFDGNVDLSPGVRLLYTRQEIPWNTLAAKAPVDTPYTHGLLVDYGLTGDSLRLGFRFARLLPTATPNDFTYTAPDTLLDFWNAALTPMLAKNWRAAYQYDPPNPAVYYNRVRIRHKTGGAFDPVDPLTDADADMMEWEQEVRAMYTENAGGHGDSTFYLVADCIGRRDAGGGLRHAICYHLRLRPKSGTGYRDLLNNSVNPAALFSMHACDFGDLCPPNCATYYAPPR